MRESSNAQIPDTQWITVTMDSGVSFVVGAGWSLPPGYPNFSTTWIEFVGTEGAVMVDDSHRDVVLNTMGKGMVLPMSTMPGEAVEHIYAGPMAAETIHFLEAVALDKPVLVTPEHARMVMEVYLAADRSAETNAPLALLIEKPLATELSESERVLRAIQNSGVDAVVGYTQRFRRRWLTAKEKVRTGQLGDVTLVTSRAFMNRLVAIDNYRRTDDPASISPMVISGTHALDTVMWMMAAQRPVEAYARSLDKAPGPLCRGTDATAGMIMFSDGSI